MARPPLLRLFACLWALWFGAIVVEPVLQSCPMHQGHAMHGMRMPAGEEHQNAGGHHSSKPHSNESCTCLGACCCAPTVALPMVAVAEVPSPRRVFDTRQATPSEERTPASAPGYAHPFANGPPRDLPA